MTYLQQVTKGSVRHTGFNDLVWRQVRMPVIISVSRSISNSMPDNDLVIRLILQELEMLRL